MPMHPNDARGRQIHQWVAAPGETVDLGWGTATINADDTVTRTCKGCGVSLTTPTWREGNVLHVVPNEFHHGDGCAVMALGIERYLGRS
jgi:hypothetical protein